MTTGPMDIPQFPRRVRIASNCVCHACGYPLDKYTAWGTNWTCFYCAPMSIVVAGLQSGEIKP